MRAVRFLAGHSPYQSGEVAGFPDYVAEAYVRARVAEPVGWQFDGSSGSSEPSDQDVNDGKFAVETIADMHYATATKRIAKIDDVELLKSVVERDGRASVVRAASDRLEELAGGGSENNDDD